MTAARLLVLTPQLPWPPDQGAPIRNWNFLRYLGGDGHYKITLLSFARVGEFGTAIEEQARTVLAKYCDTVEVVPAPASRSKIVRLQTLFTNPQPDLALRLISPPFLDKFRALIQTEKYEAVLCEGLELALFVMATFQGQAQRPRLILDEHNAEWLLQERAYRTDRQAGPKRWPAAAYSFGQARRLRRFEAKTSQFFDQLIAVSPDDKAALERIGVAASLITVIPNGIDLAEFEPHPEVAEEKESLVFTGTMDFRPNVDAVSWFVREVWPLVQKQKPHARFTIVGRRPTAQVRALGRVPGVEVTGSVPDARPYVWRSSLYVVPMRIGGGVRFKVLEALAMGKAVVTTPMGSDGINLVVGREAQVASESIPFARAILDLLDNPDYRQQLGQAGRAFVTENFDWNKLTPRLESVISG